MGALYPAIEPYEHGWLEVGQGNRVYWETSGNPVGKPTLVVHGGPGSGSTVAESSRAQRHMAWRTGGVLLAMQYAAGAWAVDPS